MIIGILFAIWSYSVFQTDTNVRRTLPLLNNSSGNIKVYENVRCQNGSVNIVRQHSEVDKFALPLTLYPRSSQTVPVPFLTEALEYLLVLALHSE